MRAVLAYARTAVYVLFAVLLVILAAGTTLVVELHATRQWVKSTAETLAVRDALPKESKDADGR